MFMRQLYIFILLISFQSVLADSLDVSGFKQIPNSIAATKYPRYDANDNQCALIKVISDIDGLGFESNLGIVGNIERKNGEYRIYVSPGERRLSIWGSNIIKYKFSFPELPKAGKVYQLIVTLKGTGIKGNYSTGFILLKTQPPGAKVWIDDDYRGITPFQQEMKGGYYTYKVEKELFYPKEGDFTVLVNETVKEEVTLEPKFGSFQVSSTPVDGALISIDGVTTNRKTPYTFDTIASGNHTVSITIDLYEPVSKEVTVNDNEKTTLEIPLNPVFGNVKITTSPQADIYIDNVHTATGTFSDILTKGLHTIEAKLDNYYPQSQKIEVKAGSTDSVSFILEPVTGSLSVVTDPPEAEIFINEKSYGYSPKIINDLLIGTYNIRLKKDNFATVNVQTEIKENERTNIKENLSNFKKITLTSNPPGAGLVLNGKSEGTTPKTLTAPFGTNKVKLTKNGYIDLEREFQVTEQKDKYSFKMTSDKKAMAQMDFRKYKKRKNIWLGATIVTAATGGYFAYSANKHYDNYKTATDNATELHDQIKTEDIIWQTALGVSGICAIITIVNASKQGKAKRQMNISALPVEGGGMVSITIPVGN